MAINYIYMSFEISKLKLQCLSKKKYTINTLNKKIHLKSPNLGVVLFTWLSFYIY